MQDWLQKMSDKIELKEKLSAIDQNVREFWDAMDAEQQKSLKSEYFIINRYMSSVKGSREEQEHFILTVNEYFNKNWSELQKHPKLLWLLLCMCSWNGNKVFYHEWIGFKRKSAGSGKKYKLLEELYPNKKLDEIELLANINSDKSIKEFARAHGLDEESIAKKLK
jgi:hypothetical protein